MMRRIVTLLLSTCLVLSLSVPAFANTKEEEMSKHASDNTLSKYGIATQEDAMPLISLLLTYPPERNGLQILLQFSKTRMTKM